MRQPTRPPPPAMGKFASMGGPVMAALTTIDTRVVQMSASWGTSGGVTVRRQQRVQPRIRLW